MADRSSECHRRSQGIIDYAMVGHLSPTPTPPSAPLAIFLVVIVFISSLFTDGRARAARPAQDHRASTVPSTGVFVAVLLAVGILAPLGYFLSPHLLGLVNARPEVRRRRCRSCARCSSSASACCCSSCSRKARAGDARTPLRLGIDDGAEPDTERRRFRRRAAAGPSARGSAVGTVTRKRQRVCGRSLMMLTGRRDSLPARNVVAAGFWHHQAAVPFGSPPGFRAWR